MFKSILPKAFVLRIYALSTAFFLMTSVPTSAQVTVDIAKVTCEQFALFKVADPDTLAVWLHGYYSGKRGTTVVEVEALKTNARKLRDYCLQHPDAYLLKAVETLLKP